MSVEGKEVVGGGDQCAKDVAMEERTEGVGGLCFFCTLQHDFGSNETDVPPCLGSVLELELGTLDTSRTHRLECEFLPLPPTKQKGQIRKWE